MIHEQNDAGQSKQINTGGGALTSGTVSTGGGDFVGRDQTIFGDQVAGDKVGGDKVMGDKHEHHHHYPHTPEAAPVPPMMALAPPPDFVSRPQEYNQLIEYLLASNTQPVAITATIRGAGGFGKTTLAQAICYDERIRAAFPDGILWTTVGDDKANVLLGLRKFYHALTSSEARFVDQDDGATQLRNELANRRCLIVVDDVWNDRHLQPFLEGGERCARLVTTRIASVIPKGADLVSLDAMQVSEATKLLGAGLTNPEAIALTKLAKRLGEWPLLLKLVNRRLYDDVEQQGIALTAAIASVNQALDEFGLLSFDVEDAAERSQAVAATISVGLQRLKPAALYGRTPVDEVARFLELAIFPEDTPIPIHTLGLLWQQTSNLSPASTEHLCRRFADLALILRYDLQTQTILLHDVTRYYLLDQASTEQLKAWHSALLDSYRSQCDNEWWHLPTDGYIYQYLLWHMQQAQQQDVLETLLFTYAWLDAKLQATDIISLIRDFDLRRNKQRNSQLGLIKHALQMSISVLVKDKDQLVGQLYGRLNDLGGNWESFINEIANQKRVIWLQPKSLNLMPPGGNLLYTLSGHRAGVDNLLLTPDGYLITSCSSRSSRNRVDTSVKVWDVERGVLLHSLQGHQACVDNLLLTPDDRLITSCRSSLSSNRVDTSVKVWDVAQGVLLHSLEGHRGSVSNLLLMPNGHLITSCNSSADTSVKVWDVAQGVLLHSLEGHREGVDNLLLTPDGCLITSCRSHSRRSSNSIDMSVKVWDVAQGVLLHSLEGHRTGVDHLLLTPGGHLITSCRSSIDMSVKVWDVAQGVLLHSLEGHRGSVYNLLLTPDGCLRNEP